MTTSDAVRELALLHALTHAVTAAADFDDAARRSIESMCVHAGGVGGACWLLNDDGTRTAGARWPASFAPRDEEPGRVTIAIVDGALVVGALELDGVLALDAADAADTKGASSIVSSATAQLGHWLGRRHAEERLRLVEERFRLLTEHVQDGVLLLTPRGDVEVWTAGAVRMFGHCIADVVGRAPTMFFEGIADALAHDRVEQAGWCTRKDGSRFWANVVACPVRAPSGAITGHAIVARDLTLSLAADALVKSNTAMLERANRELETFASIASHDLQEPLRKILAFSDRLRKHTATALDEKGQGYLTRVDDAARRMQQLIDDLLTYARLGAGNAKTADVDLAQVMREVLRDLDVTLEAARAVVDIGPLPVVAGDAMQMRQLIQNLMTNAIKFRRVGEPPAITVRARELARTADESPLVELVVEDNGIGFEDKYAERIFGMLQRLHGRSEYEGTGIGLALCRHRSYDSGASSFITKPVTFAALVESIAAMGRYWFEIVDLPSKEAGTDAT